MFKQPSWCQIVLGSKNVPDSVSTSGTSASDSASAGLRSPFTEDLITTEEICLTEKTDTPLDAQSTGTFEINYPRLVKLLCYQSWQLLHWHKLFPKSMRQAFFRFLDKEMDTTSTSTGSAHGEKDDLEEKEREEIEEPVVTRPKIGDCLFSLN